ncbi:hypothetical protein [Moorella sp. Hama-1]|uniref:hypothetical protein n=1 Tax=Moorella sp. Hama-1 TaxID=2138101 RepID=UPI000D656ED7|nr:hypothetical protein [Moorella sp. Hama-1]MDN5362870.1 hypothetical protein [Moorella sp. (in: firmicutes)]BCV21989.1 hypothetical protein hamaS1_20580 [Moorella sp. Hama-1]
MAVASKAEKVISVLAEKLNLPRENIVEQGIRAFLEKHLRATKAEIFHITGKYGIKSVEEMEARYATGTLEEKGTWEDFQRLDHLEYKKEQLEKLLGELK